MTNGCIGCTKKPLIIPKYAYIVDTCDDIWEEKPNTRYPIYWKLGCTNLYSTIDANIYNKVDFCNIDIWGGFKRVFVKSISEDNIGIFVEKKIEDDINEAFAHVYCKSSDELLIIGLSASEARFGGIVIQPMGNLLKIYRHKHLMNKWRRLTPLIGKWTKFLIQLHDEVVYRPGNSGATKVEKHFEICTKIKLC